MEPALLAVIQALHQAFIDSHLREHEQADTMARALEEERGATAREQDSRYAERFVAQEKAVDVAAATARVSLEAALAATKEAISKSEVAQEKKSDATYVSIVKLQEAMSQVMPRAEAENRFRTQDVNMGEVRDRLKAIEAMKQGYVEQRSETQQIVPWIAAAIAVIGVLVSIAAVVALVLTSKH